MTNKLTTQSICVGHNPKNKKDGYDVFIYSKTGNPHIICKIFPTKKINAENLAHRIGLLIRNEITKIKT